MATQVLQGGRIIDPAHQVDRVGDLVITDGRVAGIDVPFEAHASVIDCRGNLVLPGLIDTHAHVFRYVTGRFGLDADTCGVHSGVTTLIDQGGPSCITIPAFRHYIEEPAKSRVKAFISAYLVGGLEGHYYPELYRPGCLDVDATVKAAVANRDLVRGVKAHAELGGFERWGLDVMRLAAEVGRQADLPVYIHFGQLWPSPSTDRRHVEPDSIFEQVLDLVKPGDVLAHPFSRHPGGFMSTKGTVHPLVSEAVARGARIDVGHGSHFSFEMARHVLAAGFVPDTLGADMHGYNTHVPHPPATPEIHPDEGDHMFAGAVRFSLVSAMTSMLALGVSLPEVVAMVTRNAARLLQMEDEIGHLGTGAVADVSVLFDERGKWTLRDNEGNQAVTSQYLRPRFCLRAGEYFESAAQILPQPQPLAA